MSLDIVKYPLENYIIFPSWEPSWEDDIIGADSVSAETTDFKGPLCFKAEC